MSEISLSMLLGSGEGRSDCVSGAVVCLLLLPLREGRPQEGGGTAYSGMDHVAQKLLQGQSASKW